MLYRSYLISSVLILALFATAQYRGWSLVGASETKGLPGSAQGVYHK
jgi:hypothetical protein